MPNCGAILSCVFLLKIALTLLQYKQNVSLLAIKATKGMTKILNFYQ
ncbi:hypothetical protein PESP_a0979 [Pseudoalteromonas espejiana DSM 9414]|nr:hypothetical protein PESP_a0979 [Pseudoalteromonas espejiana DSM 9414]